MRKREFCGMFVIYCFIQNKYINELIERTSSKRGSSSSEWHIIPELEAHFDATEFSKAARKDENCKVDAKQ